MKLLKRNWIISFQILPGNQENDPNRRKIKQRNFIDFQLNLHIPYSC